MVLKRGADERARARQFENDVKQYGTQANITFVLPQEKFENDVKQYGTQALRNGQKNIHLFENDVKQYGTQATFSINI